LVTDKMQLMLTIHYLVSLNFATVTVQLSAAHETCTTVSGGFVLLSASVSVCPPLYLSSSAPVCLCPFLGVAR